LISIGYGRNALTHKNRPNFKNTSPNPPNSNSTITNTDQLEQSRQEIVVSIPNDEISPHVPFQDQTISNYNDVFSNKEKALSKINNEEMKDGNSINPKIKMNQQVAMLQMSNKKIPTQFADLDKNPKGLKQKNIEFNENNSNLDKENENLKRELEQLRRKIVKLMQDNNNNNEQLKVVTKKNQDLENTLGNKISILTQRNEQLKIEVVQQYNNLSCNKANIENLELALKTNNEKLINLKESLINKIEQCQDNINNLNVQNDQQRIKFNQHKIELNDREQRLLKQLSEKDNKINELNVKVSQVKNLAEKKT